MHQLKPLALLEENARVAESELEVQCSRKDQEP